MKFPRNTKIFRGQLDAAPFAAVFFLLVIFLLLHSSLVFTPGVPIHLPEAADLPGTANDTVVVAVDENGQLYFDNQVIERDRLKDKLQSAVAAARQPLSLIVQADGKVKVEQLLKLLLLARSAGIKEIIQASRPPVIATTAPKS